MIILINTDLLFDTEKLIDYTAKEKKVFKTKKDFVESIVIRIKEKRKDNMTFKIISDGEIEEKLSFIFTNVNIQLEKQRLKIDFDFTTKKISITELDESYEYLDPTKKVSNEIYFKNKEEVESYITNLLNCSNLRSIYFCQPK